MRSEDDACEKEAEDRGKVETTKDGDDEGGCGEEFKGLCDAADDGRICCYLCSCCWRCTVMRVIGDMWGWWARQREATTYWARETRGG